jgi:hypothetical protein
MAPKFNQFVFFRQDLQDFLDFYFFGFPDESQKSQFAFGKNIFLWLIILQMCFINFVDIYRC